MSATTRLAVIVSFVQLIPGISDEKLEKLIYLLQTLTEVDAGYVFHLSGSSPYSVDVYRDISAACETPCGRGRLLVLCVVVGLRTHERILSAGQAVDSFWPSQDERDKTIACVSRIADAYGVFSTNQLRLVASIIFAARERKHRTETQLVDRVYQIRPFNPKTEIRQQVALLHKNGHLCC